MSVSNDKCYASIIGGCSEQISKEHWVSRTILESMGDITIEGASWQGGQKKKISPNAFCSKILCTNHNNMLSELDDEGGRFYNSLLRVTVEGHLGYKNEQHNFCGLKIERWILKVLCGYIASNSITYDEPYTSFRIPQEWIEILFGARAFPCKCGLYVHALGPKDINQAKDIRIKPLVDSKTSAIIGGIVELRGIEFYLLLVETGQHNKYQYHTEKIHFRTRPYKYTLRFHW